MRTNWLLAVLAGGLAALAGCKKSSSGGGDGVIDASTGHELYIADPEIGNPMRGTLKMDMRIAVAVSGKQNDKKDQTIREDMSYRATVLECPPGAKKPTRALLFIDKWDTSTATVSDKGVRDRILGKEILIQKNGDQYRFTNPNGSPIDPNVTIQLNEVFKKLYESIGASDFMPDKPVGTGDTWSIPVGKMMRAVNESGMLQIDQAKSKGAGKLISVSTRDNRKFGRMEITTQIYPVQIMGAAIKPGGKIETTTQIEACIDGSKHDIKVEAKIDSQMEFTMPGENLTVKMETKGEIKVNEVEEGNGRPPRTQAGNKSKPGISFGPETTAEDPKQMPFEDGKPIRAETRPSGKQSLKFGPGGSKAKFDSPPTVAVPTEPTPFPKLDPVDKPKLKIEFPPEAKKFPDSPK